jgi:predicted Fe-Mo cluster-binding NifX family protein
MQIRHAICVLLGSMIVALPVWQGRISPVFDVAGQLLVVDLRDSTIPTRRLEILPEEAPELRAQRVQALGIETLICGAVSRPLEALLTAKRIEVLPRICGDVEEVLQAFMSERLRDDRFAMPGCCGRRQRRRRGGCQRGNRPSDR